MSEALPIKKIKEEPFLHDDDNLDYAFALAIQTNEMKENINSNLKKEVDEMKSVPFENAFYKSNFDTGNGDAFDPNEILDYYAKGDHFNEYFGDDGNLKYPGYSFDHSPQLADEPTSGTSAPLNYVEPPNLPPLGPTPSFNNYMYQYPDVKLPHTAVSEKSPSYPPYGQGFPSKEEQQLSVFHVQENSNFEKLPSTLSADASHTFQTLPSFSQSVSSASTSKVVSSLPPTASSSISIPRLNTISVPYTSQTSLSTSVIAPRINFLSPQVTQATSSIAMSAATSNSQLKNSLQRPSVIKTVAYGGQGILINKGQKTAPFHLHEASKVRKSPPPYSATSSSLSGNVPHMSTLQIASGLPGVASTSTSNPLRIKVNNNNNNNNVFQSLLSTTYITPPINSLPLITQATLSALLPSTSTSHSQSKASLQTKSSSRASRTNTCESVKVEKKKNYNCLSCTKSYIGRAGLARHYRAFPTHGSLAENDRLSAQENPQQIVTKTPPRVTRKRNNEKLENPKKLKAATPEAEVIELERETHYNNLLALADNDLVKNVEKFDCPICLSEIGVGEGVMLQECLHSFCRDCLVGTIQFSETPLVVCPFQNDEYKCESHLQEREVKSLVTPEIYEKHLQRSLAIAETQAQNSFHCKTSDCPGWCLFEDDVNTFQCPVCNHVNCLTCSAIHEGKNCRQYQEDVELDSSEEARKTKKCLQELLDNGNAMRCPKCQVVIVKKGGCNMMTCSMCHGEFKWTGKESFETPLQALILQNANVLRTLTVPLNINVPPQSLFRDATYFTRISEVVSGLPADDSLPAERDVFAFRNLWPEQNNIQAFQISLPQRLTTSLAQATTSTTLPAAATSHSQLNNPLQMPPIAGTTLYRNGANFTITTRDIQDNDKPKEMDTREIYGATPVVTIYDSEDESREMDVSEPKENPQQITTKPPIIISIRKRNGEKQESNDGLREAEENKMHIETDYDRLLALADVDLVQNVEKFECPICFSDIDVGEGVTLQDCLHSFCRECLAGAIKFSETPSVKCPFQNDEYKCESYLQEREVKALVTPDIYEKYLQRSMVLAENQAQNSFHCKTPDCPGWCFFEDDVNIFPCPVCRRSNCLTCSAIHEGRNCAQYQEDVELDTSVDARKTKEYLQKMLNSRKAMRCPKCRVIVMKKEGCDWLMCTMCRTEICWVTRGPRWGPKGFGDNNGGCGCKVNGVPCHPKCGNCH